MKVRGNVNHAAEQSMRSSRPGIPVAGAHIGNHPDADAAASGGFPRPGQERPTARKELIEDRPRRIGRRPAASRSSAIGGRPEEVCPVPRGRPSRVPVISRSGGRETRATASTSSPADLVPPLTREHTPRQLEGLHTDLIPRSSRDRVHAPTWDGRPHRGAAYPGARSTRVLHIAPEDEREESSRTWGGLGLASPGRGSEAPPKRRRLWPPGPRRHDVPPGPDGTPAPAARSSSRRATTGRSGAIVTKRCIPAGSRRASQLTGTRRGCPSAGRRPRISPAEGGPGVRAPPPGGAMRPRPTQREPPPPHAEGTRAEREPGPRRRTRREAGDERGVHDETRAAVRGPRPGVALALELHRPGSNRERGGGTGASAGVCPLRARTTEDEHQPPAAEGTDSRRIADLRPRGTARETSSTAVGPGRGGRSGARSTLYPSPPAAVAAQARTERPRARAAGTADREPPP